MELEKEIKETEQKLQEIRDRRDPEVYSRIVGYYRSVSNWVPGKKKEHEMRTQFDPDSYKRGA